MDRPESGSTTLDHAEAREQLDALLLERGSLTTLGDDPSAAAQALRAHLAVCPPCRRELAAVQTTGLLLANAAPDDLPLRPELRSRVLQAVRQTGAARPSAGPAPERPLRVSDETRARKSWLGLWSGGQLAAGLAATVAVIVLVGGLLLGRGLMQQRDAASAQLAALTHVTTAADRLLATPDHRQMTLHDPSGAAGGTVLFDPDSGELLVFSAGLGTEAGGEPYDCFVEHGGQRTRIGWMEAAGGVAYWVGGLPAGTTLASGDRFLVETDDPGATPALSGTL
ncbi:MAG TPA: anti-sigma factor [Candidatus Limnocylindrales bacterium]|nr:anti-sigma factor [Candidatus Limnocylindrales bacterium]